MKSNHVSKTTKILNMQTEHQLIPDNVCYVNFDIFKKYFVYSNGKRSKYKGVDEFLQENSLFDLDKFIDRVK